MTTGDDKRAEYRLEHRASVFVELPTSDDAIVDEDFPHTVPSSPELLLCRILDVSANGLRIRIDRELPVGALLTLSARFPGGRGPMHKLVGEVRWVRPEGDYHAVGFSLFDADETDILTWKKLVAEEL